jgi:steroid 5-alpha reductase family enzyme
MTILLIGFAAVALLMFILWLIHFPMHNAAIVDVGWAGGLALLGAIYAWQGAGWPSRKALIGSLAVIWGVRLATYLLGERIIGHPEEGRYQELRRRWKTGFGWKFLVFFEFQALLCIVLSAPFWLAAANPEPAFHWLELAGAAVWCCGILGESLADRQLAAFKANPANRGRTCRAGLWNYSRHPNYFFEWIIWMGFALIALPADFGYLGLISPALILYFVLRVTGIPATEDQAVRSRGEDYREYQRTTSAFVPWFPKRKQTA